jgi:type I restriction enzyme, S subunit
MKDSGVPWLGEVPEHWEVPPNRALFTEVKERDHPEEQMLSVTITRGVIRQRALLADSSKKDSSRQDKSAYKLLRPGDIAYNKMRAWQGAVGMSKYRGIVSPAYVVRRPRAVADPRYLHYLLRTPAFAKEAERWSYGITSDMWSLRPEHFKMIYACLPSLPEQVAIVRFLDHVDQRIRRYIRAKQKLIGLLEEQKQAIIHRAVTRGLDPNVRLKSSGVEWLGDVPRHWEVTTLGRLSRSFKTGPFGSALHQSDYVSDGVPLINPVHMRGGQILANPDCTVASETFERLRDYELRKDDLVFSRRGELGRCALVREVESGWLCGTGSIRVRLLRGIVDPAYLIAALQVKRVGEYLSLMSVGATMESLNTGILKSLPLVLPPEGEQAQVTSWIEAASRKGDQASQKVEREIALLREYRTRLIADVVTGKLDVREAAARLPEEPDEPEPLNETDVFADAEETPAEDPDAVPVGAAT